MDSTYRPSFARPKRKISDVDSEEEEEADARPSFGFKGFAPASTHSPSSTPTMTPHTRPGWQNTSSNGKAGTGSKAASAKATSSFAARMMAKMGYVEGKGLGTTGQGILNPVETVLRPQGVGLGAVKEKSQQAKDEARREAARRGEVLVTSSDEERKQRQKRKERRQREGIRGSGTSTPRGPSKPKYRTAREIEADAAGLAVPTVLKSLIDATGREQKLLTSTAGLMTPMEFVNADESEAWKIARRARNDLEAFADEWKGLSERKKYTEIEEAQVVEEIDAQTSKLTSITSLTHAIEALDISNSNEGLDERWEAITKKLEDLGKTYRDFIDEYRLSEVAVAAIHPIFKKSLEDWAPLSKPTYLVSYFQRLYQLMSQSMMTRGDNHRPRQSTTPYESMMYSLWLPRVRSALLNQWEVQDSGPAISLIEGWKGFLPEFVYCNVMNQMIVPKLSAAIKAWKPKGSKKNNELPQYFPWWLFDWLRHLDEHHTDPKAPTGLLSDAKRKFRVLLDTWDLARGLVPKIGLWKEVLGSEFDRALQTHMLPRLSRHLQVHFDINPQEQDLTAFEDVMKWKPFFKPTVIGLLLSAEFFPKWHTILHLWLTSDPNYDEIGQWFSWWKSQIPDEINTVPEVAAEWSQGLKTINLALDLGDKVKTDLPLPPSGSNNIRQKQPHDKHRDKGPPSAKDKSTKSQKKHVEEPSFKDIVEEWCGDEGLIMVPLREAHLQSGLPLFRLTASANGKGGVLVYLKGDVVWAQNKKSKDVWEPAGLDAGLVSRAEGN